MLYQLSYAHHTRNEYSLAQLPEGVSARNRAGGSARFEAFRLDPRRGARRFFHFHRISQRNFKSDNFFALALPPGCLCDPEA